MSTTIMLTAIALFILQSVSMKLIRAESISDKLLVNGIFSAIAGIGMTTALAAVPSLRGISSATLAFGLLFGLLFALTILFYNLAVSTGPLSYTAFYFSASMLIPTAAGILFFNEPLTPALIIGALLFLAAFYLLNVPGSMSGNITITPPKQKKKWLLFCMLTFLGNGLLAVVQKSHQMISGGTQASGLMLVGFLSASVFYFIVYLLMRKIHRKGSENCTVTARSVAHANLVPALLLAAGSLGGNLLITYLAGIMSGSYLFPVVQGSIILGVTLVSVFMFKERLSLYGKCGILTGILAIVAINL